MKKVLTLSALAAVLVAPAFAQSSVTIYGRLNASIERQTTHNKSDFAMVNSSSRLGFKGTEDLGGGLKANFVLEHGFNPANGTASSTFWGREATVGISGNFGSFRLGRAAATDAYFATADYVSMHNHDTGTSSDAYYAGAALIAGLSNSITYTTPTYSGVSASVQYADSTVATGGKNPIVLASNYDAGPLHVGFGFEKVGDQKTTSVRGLYELGAYTVGGYLSKDTGSMDRLTFRLAGMYTQGNSEYHVNFGRANAISGVAASSSNQFTLGYNYNLSKRTKLYTFYTKLDNGDNAPYAIISGQGDQASSLALGVRHNF